MAGAGVWILDRFSPGPEEVELVDQLGRRGIAAQWLDWDELGFEVGGRVRRRGEPLPPPAAALVRSRVFTRADDVSLVTDCLRMLECAGIDVVNGADAIQRAHNKVLAAEVLATSGLPVPATRLVRSVVEAGRCLLDWHDVVFKPVSGHSTVGLARFVREPEDGYDTPPGVTVYQEVQLWHLLRTHGALCAQQYVGHSGLELRVLVVDGVVVACNRRAPVYTELGGGGTTPRRRGVARRPP